MSAFDPTAKITSSGTVIQATSEPGPRTFRPGEVVAGIYRIDHLVGEGGMGMVLAATHLPSQRRMALKLVQPDTAGEQGAVARFWREARAVSRLSHPNVVRVFDVGSLADDTPYMAMELLEGESLGERMDRLGPMPVDAARELIRQACEAVAAAHAIGVVHRDLKPQNMFLTRGETGAEVLKVLDFGISKTMRATVSDDHQKLTKTTDVFGSPTYMSPEQLKASRDVDERTDVWALGVILHEMIAGAPPFGGKSVAEIFGAILYKPPEPLSKLRPDVPRHVETAVLRALEKDRDKRTATVRELRDALLGSPAAATAPATTNTTATATGEGPRGRLLPVLALIAFVLAGVAAFVIARLVL